MTREEAQAWKQYTEINANRWRVDQIHNSRKDLLVYCGDGFGSGKFASIRENTLEIGSYTDALPHIGEGCFKVEASRTFNTNQDATRFLIERGGVSFLRDILGA